MASAILHGTINVVVSPGSAPNGELSFDNDEVLHIYIEEISQVPKDTTAQEHPKSNGSILLGETEIQLVRDHKFPLEFQCKYDPTKVSHGQFDQLCDEGFIVVGAEVDADGRDMTTFWLKSGLQKFQQNIKLVLTDSYG